MILINGTNFIDGLNGLVLSYYLVIIILIFKLGLFEYSFLDNLNIYYLMVVILYLILFNIFNQLYLGDSGSYLIGFAIGYFLLQIYENSLDFSPFYCIITMVPCF